MFDKMVQFIVMGNLIEPVGRKYTGEDDTGYKKQVVVKLIIFEDQFQVPVLYFGHSVFKEHGDKKQSLHTLIGQQLDGRSDILDEKKKAKALTAIIKPLATIKNPSIWSS